MILIADHIYDHKGDSSKINKFKMLLKLCFNAILY